MLKKISHGIVNKMNKIYPRLDEDNQKMAYYIETTLDQILILVAVFIACFLVGYSREAFICYIGFLLFRTFAGGLHFKKRILCFMVTASVVLFGGLIIYMFNLPTTACYILLSIDLILVAAFAPQATKNNPITPKFKMIRKIESIVLICLFMLILVFSHGIWGRGLTVGASLASITILPIFMKLTE